jgi:hypothetical protein
MMCVGPTYERVFARYKLHFGSRSFPSQSPEYWRRLALSERSYTRREPEGPCTPSLQEADEADVAGGRIASPFFGKSFIN